MVQDLGELGKEKSEGEKFLEEYNALCQKYGMSLKPRIGFEVISIPKE